MTLTLVTMLKRRKGLRWREFHDMYERHHALIADNMLAGFATRYEWRYLRPVDDQVQNQDYDVILEIDFPDAPTCEACFSQLKDIGLLDKIEAAEELLFDRSRLRVFTVENNQWPMRPVRHNTDSANDA